MLQFANDTYLGGALAGEGLAHTVLRMRVIKFKMIVTCKNQNGLHGLTVTNVVRL